MMTDLMEKCPVCAALLDEEDLFCSNCGRSAPHATDELDGQASRTATHNFQCDNCGASMSYDASAGTLRCPFCGSEKLQQQQDLKVLSPQAVVPFQIARHVAQRALRQWLGQGFWRPGDLVSTATIEKAQPVYVPFWVFAAQTHTYWTADSSDTPPGTRGDWMPVTGEHHGRYDGVLVGASGSLTPAETQALGSFDLSAGVAPESVDLENITVEQFTVGRKYARPLARHGLEQLERRAVATRYLPGHHRNLKVNVRVQQQRSVPMLLPVWIMAYRYRGKVFRTLINGQTGQLVGEAPFSYLKAILVGGLLLLVVLAVLALMAANA